MAHVSHAAVSSTLRAVITRADGAVEDLGVISYWHKNPFKRAVWHVTKFLGLS